MEPTFHWKWTNPCPLPFMLAIGGYAVVESQWEGKPVTYY